MTVFILLNYKTYQETISLTRNLLKQGLGNRRIIIVDNLSHNGAFGILEKEFNGVLNVDVVSSGENGGYAKGNNYGLRFAKRYNPDYACIINNDIKFSIKDIETLEQKYNHLGNVGLVAPIQKLPSGEIADFYKLYEPTFIDDLISYVPYLDKLKKFRHKYYENTNKSNVQQVDIIPGAFIFGAYSLLESIGFLDEETFLFCEERFLSKKIKMINKENFILLDSYYIHDHSTTINSEASVIKQMRMILDGRIKYTYRYRKNPHIKSFILKSVCEINVLLMYIRSFLRKFIKTSIV